MHTTVRYKDLRDPSIESSQFVYHLHELMHRKLVEKVGRGEYRLSAKGVILAQEFSSVTGNIRSATLSYTMIFLRSKVGKWYVLRRTKHPHIDMYACISGKIHLNETLAEAAQREMNDFAAGIDITLSYRGYASVMVQQGDQTTHITGPVWFADNLDEIELKEVRQGTPQWVDWKTLPYEQFIPGWKEIVEMIESGTPSYLDLSFTL